MINEKRAHEMSRQAREKLFSAIPENCGDLCRYRVSLHECYILTQYIRKIICNENSKCAFFKSKAEVNPDV